MKLDECVEHLKWLESMLFGLSSCYFKPFETGFDEEDRYFKALRAF